MKMNRGLLLAVTVGIGSFIQGWIYILLIGHPSYMKEEFNMEREPERDGLVWSVSMIGLLLALISVRIGHRPLLVVMSLLYLFCSVVMLWSGDISLVLASRFLDGFAWGFSHILVAFYFMEVAPWGFWRFLLPQLASLCGVFLCLMVAEMPLANGLSWRIIFSGAFSLSLLYFILVVFYLPESPKCLVSKGRIDEARRVLQTIRGSKDVSDELDWLVDRSRIRGGSSIDEELNCGSQDRSSDSLVKPVSLLTSKADITSVLTIRVDG